MTRRLSVFPVIDVKKVQVTGQKKPRQIAAPGLLYSPCANVIVSTQLPPSPKHGGEVFSVFKRPFK
ncbi:hypothetical protein [Pseudomonas sp. BW7P1]|uniref:hypothetical protein n=1 Tax=Pseudomonas TaxID=286 RepID=UPI0021ADBC16|nr:hypothetical protein [Pseudomonas sp. BW7P1]UWI61144.1 hypothetical protein NWV16_24165 [Pseudomonas sp. BW7P1]